MGIRRIYERIRKSPYIVFSEDILKKLINSQILSQTNEYGHFNAYKVVDKENFIHQYVNKINATKIKKDIVKNKKNK